MKHPRCTFNGPHAAHNFVTYTEPIDITHLGPQRVFEPIPESHRLEQLWCNGEVTPLERENAAEDDGWRQWWAGAGTWTEDQ